jgi:hypothetical protein
MKITKETAVITINGDSHEVERDALIDCVKNLWVATKTPIDAQSELIEPDFSENFYSTDVIKLSNPFGNKITIEF